jgi:IS30 family transposase
VVRKLKSGYSPEQIAGTLPLAHSGEHISHEAIYQYIYAAVHRNGWGLLRRGEEDLRKYLKRRHKRRVKKGLRGAHKVPRFQGRSIEARPLEVAERKTLGHWEGDSVVSRKSRVAINTLVERVSGLVFITKIKNGTAEVTRKAVRRKLGSLPPALRKTLTVDNGSENAEIALLEEDLPGLEGYLAHPNSSFERGTNENTNGLIRWYLPKGTDFATISGTELRKIERALNTRPRKRLGWQTPLEVFRASVALTG